MTAPLPSLNKLSLQRDTGMEASSSTIVRIPSAGRPMTDAEFRARLKRVRHLADLVNNMEPKYVRTFLEWLETMELKKELPKITIDSEEWLEIQLSRLTDQEFEIFDRAVVDFHGESQKLTHKKWEKLSAARKIELAEMGQARLRELLEENERKLCAVQGREYNADFLTHEAELQAMMQDDVDMGEDSESSDS